MTHVQFMLGAHPKDLGSLHCELRSAACRQCERVDAELLSTLRQAKGSS